MRPWEAFAACLAVSLWMRAGDASHNPAHLLAGRCEGEWTAGEDVVRIDLVEDVDLEPIPWTGAPNTVLCEDRFLARGEWRENGGEPRSFELHFEDCVVSARFDSGESWTLYLAASPLRRDDRLSVTSSTGELRSLRRRRPR